MRCLSLVMLVAVFVIIGCDSMTGDVKGDYTFNTQPVVEFTNVPANQDTFSYAPVIHWKGRDSDGFVEHFSYADVIDPTAIADPEYFIDFIPENAWVQTEATSDTVYLLTQTGEITEHIFYLKCTDDKGAESLVKYRSFYRSNRPPDVPVIKWYSAAETEFSNDIFLTDTLYCLNEITDTWPGLGFSWKSSDPDDRDLYTIPLEYKYYLEKVPHDTIWTWVSQSWISDQELQFFGLETGHYKFSVWARDDGLEMSVRPASATFDVYKPTFEQPLLIINTTVEDEAGSEGRGNVIPGTQIGELYQQLASSYPGMTNYEYVHLPSPEVPFPWKSYLGRFNLVILVSENLASPGFSLSEQLNPYLNIGGSLWVISGYTRQNGIIGATLMNAANSTFAEPIGKKYSELPDFIAASAGVDFLPTMSIDTVKVAEVYDLFRRRMPYPFLPGIDIISRGLNVETAYLYKSYTDTLSGMVYGDTAEVKVYADTTYYPPTPEYCLVKLPRNRVLEVINLVNVTRGDTGEVVSLTNNAFQSGDDRFAVVRVHYPWGEPWSVNDVIIVDYEYQPYSEFHLRPCGIRYEKLSEVTQGQGYDVRYRIAVFTFPLYFLDNSQGDVTTMFHSMLDWFYTQGAH